MLCWIRSAGLSFLYPSTRSDYCVWLRDTCVVPSEKCAGELDVRVLHIPDQAEDFPEAEHVLRRCVGVHHTSNGRFALVVGARTVGMFTCREQHRGRNMVLMTPS